jgi:hypothetical protein
MAEVVTAATASVHAGLFLVREAQGQGWKQGTAFRWFGPVFEGGGF